MDAQRRGRGAGPLADGGGGPDRTDVTDREVVLTGAVVGTLTTVLVPAVYLGPSALLQAGRSGPGSLADMWTDSLVFLALVGAIAMSAIYLVGVPFALQIERRLAGRAAARWLAYVLAGAISAAAVGTFFAGPTAGVLVFAMFGLVAALGGAGGVAWARRRPPRVVRRAGPGATGALVVVTLVAWLMTGAVLVPLLVASAAGALTLILCLLTERNTSTV